MKPSPITKPDGPLLPLQRPLRDDPWRLVNRAGRARAKAATRLVYAPAFGDIGPRSVVYRPLFLSGTRGITIGARSSIRQGARIELIALPGQPLPRLVIGDDVTIEQGVHIVCTSEIVLENRVSLAPSCTLLDCAHPANDGPELINPASMIAGPGRPIRIGSGALLGIRTVVLPGVQIGRGAVTGANSVITRSVDAFVTVAGAPARKVRAAPAAD